ncbi:hypothetical protein X777_04848, partial [Ooceraea biroi]
VLHGSQLVRSNLMFSNYFNCDDDCADAGTELAAGTPILLDHALSHHLTICSIQ